MIKQHTPATDVVKFTIPVRGREKAAIAYAREVDGCYAKKAAEGLCAEPEPLRATVGESMWIAEGQYEALLGILATPEAQKLLVMGPILAEGFGWGLYQVGDEEMLGRYELGRPPGHRFAMASPAWTRRPLAGIRRLLGRRGRAERANLAARITPGNL